MLGVVVDGRLGLLSNYIPDDAARLIDCRLVSPETPLSEVFNKSHLRHSDWVLVAASRVDEVPPNTDEVVIWRSPLCTKEDVYRSLEGQRHSIFISRVEELDDLEGKVKRVLLSGWESHGVVGEESTLVLLRRVLACTAKPVWVLGGLGPDAAAGAIAAGATGVFLGDVLWATPEAEPGVELLQFLERFDPSDTDGLGRFFGFRFRAFRQLASKPPKRFEKEELQLAERPGTSQDEIARECWLRALSLLPRAGWDNRNNLLPIGQSGALARSLRDRFGHVDDIVAHYRQVVGTSCQGILKDYPFVEGNRLARRMGLRFPLFQGPMSQVSDVPEFIEAIARSGAMPWVAFSNMPDYAAEPLLASVSEMMAGGCFGVGVIGMDSNRYRDAHLELLYQNPPPWVMIGAGTVEQALTFEGRGIPAFLHIPAVGMLKTALRQGLRHFVLEGAEAGGHTGKLGLVSLCQLAVDVLLDEAASGLDLETVSIVVAGGISDKRAAHFAAAMIHRLHTLGVAVGLQLGTAYLMTTEAVQTQALSPLFQRLLAKSDTTRLLGMTVNTPTRVVRSPYADEVLRREDQRLRDNINLRERKHLYEDDNFGGLRAAAKGQRIEFTDESRKHVRMIDIETEEQMENGLFHAGQTAALLDRVCSAAHLNSELTQTPLRAERPASPGRVGSRSVMRVEKATDGSSAMEAIAIVGLGAKVPGALSVDTFWDNIVNRHYAVTDVPKDKWDSELFWDPDPLAPDKTYSKIGGFVKGFEFDRRRFRIPPKVVRSIDISQQLALAAAADALEDAGLLQRDFDRSRCAVIVGSAMGGDLREDTAGRVRFVEYAQALLSAAREEPIAAELLERLVRRTEEIYKADLPPVTEDSMPGELANIVAGRISNAFDLGGPSYIADAACASSLAALDGAVRGLNSGSYDIAVAGGSDCCMSPATYVKFAKIGALSGDLSCPFDQRANGFVMGEGAVILILKRLADAVAAGDKIYAVIRGVGGASDGRGKGITAPNPDGQLRAMKAAYRDAGVRPQTLGLLEAHGTSTRVGDVVEAASFSMLFKEERATQPIAIGSVKSNIGHLKAAAGAAGLFKATMALHHRVIPPTCNVEVKNPKIDFDAAPLIIPSEATDWRSNGHPRRAGVSSFGFGGTNFHVVLEEYDPDSHHPKRIKSTTTRRSTPSYGEGAPHTFDSPHRAARAEIDAVGISADSEGELSKALADMLDALKLGGRQAFESFRIPNQGQRGSVRLAIAAQSANEAITQAEKAQKALEAGKSFRILENQGIYLRKEAIQTIGGTALLFPGQGSQYLNMGADLRQRYRQVDQAFSRSDAVLRGELKKPLSEYVFVEDESKEAFLALTQTEVTQPAVLTLDSALLEILRAHGVEADCVAGHSLGEYAACFAAGVLTFENAIRTVAVRGTAMANVQPLEGDRGLMVSVPMDAPDVEPHIVQFDGRVVIANKNSPKQTIIAGYTREMERAIAYFEELGVQTIKLPVSHAFHTEIVSPASGPLGRFLVDMDIRKPTTRILTNVSGGCYPDDAAEIRQLLSVQLAHPVQWRAIIENMYAEGIRTFVEVGPKRALTNFVIDTLGEREHRAYFSNHPKFGGPASLARLFAALWADGRTLSVDKLEKSSSATLTPTSDKEHTPFQKEKDTNGDETPQTPASGMFGWANQVLASTPVAQTPKTGNRIGAQIATEKKRNGGMLSWTTAALEAPETSTPVADSQSTAISWGETYRVLLDELCEKTGYDSDEIEPDFELEADLGVDTVKQAEIMSAVREHFELERDEDFRLADYPTLKDLASYLVDRIGEKDGVPETTVSDIGNAPALLARAATLRLRSGQAPDRPYKASDNTEKTAVDVPVTSDDAYRVLLEELCEKTGYDPDEIEPDFELEADLGVDTVKQAEIMSAVRERFELERDEDFRLADYPTLSDLAGYIADRIANVEPSQTEATHRVDRPSKVLPLLPSMDEITPPEQREYERPIEKAQLTVVPPAAAQPLDFGEFGPNAVRPEERPPVVADMGVLRKIFGGRTVAFVNVDAPLRRALGQTFSRLQAETLSVTAESEQELVDTFSAMNGDPSKLAVINGVGLVVGDPTEAGLQFLRLARALAQLVPEKRFSDIPVLTLTRSGGLMGLDSGGCAASGVVCGMTKALAREWSSRVVRAIDLASEPVDESYVVSILAQAFLGAKLESGYAFGRRYVASEMPVEASVPVAFSRDDVIVLTGGARGVTAQVAVELGRRYQCKLALLDLATDDGTRYDLAVEKERLRKTLTQRHERVTPAMVRDALAPFQRANEALDTLEAIRGAGGTAQCWACDVTDRRSVAQAISEVLATYGRIDGVIHGAGIDVSRLLLDKDEQTAKHVLDTKLLGAANLLWALREEELRFFVGFGSVVGRFGNAGQIDYAGANDGMAKMLSQLSAHKPNVQSLTIEWTGWRDVGMAVNGGTHTLMEQRGIGLLPAEAGARYCCDLIAAGVSGEAIVASGLGDLRELPGVTQHSGANDEDQPEAAARLSQVDTGLLETIEIAADGLSAEAGVLLEAEEPYLNHHRIDGTPVLPGVIGIEMCTQLCTRLASKRPFSGVENFRFLRPVKLHRDEPLQLIIRAERSKAQSDGTVLFAVKVESTRASRTGKVLESEHFSGVLRFGGPGEGWRSPIHLSVAGRVFEGFGAETIYKYFFHTGPFALTEELVAVGDEFAVGSGSILPIPISSMGGQLLTDPLVTELAFQVGGLFGLCHHKGTFLPARIGRLTNLQKAETSKRLTARIAVREVNVERLVFDAEVITDEGHPVARLSDVEMINAGATDKQPPKLNALELVVAHLQEDELREKLHPSQIAANGELEEFARKKTDKGRQEWILSRTLVKRTVADYYRHYYGVGLKPTDIHIVKNSFGAPGIEVKHDLGTAHTPPLVSISHSEGRAIVALVPSWRRTLAGIDLERVVARTPRFAYDYFSKQERAVIEKRAEDHGTTTAMWSLKEAASKALGLGTHLDFRKEIAVTEMESDTAELRFEGRAQEQLNKLGVSFESARWKVEDGFATAAVELSNNAAKPSVTELASVAALLLHMGHDPTIK